METLAAIFGLLIIGYLLDLARGKKPKFRLYNGQRLADDESIFNVQGVGANGHVVREVLLSPGPSQAIEHMAKRGIRVTSIERVK